MLVNAVREILAGGGSQNFTIIEPLTPQEIEDFVAYHYIPTLWICALFIALYSLSTLIHIGEAIYFRLWWIFPTAVLAGTAEIIGWSARLWSSKNPLLITPFLMQISTTIIAPTPLVAANFLILGRLIKRLGYQYSRLSPNSYAIIFCSADVIALVVQAVGGGIASSEAAGGDNAAMGGHIMLGGIVFQLVIITIYVALASEFLLRVTSGRPIAGRVPAVTEDKSFASTDESHPAYATRTEGALTPRLKLMLFGLSFSTLCIFIRSVYRTVELSDGWNGRIISTERYFDWLDGGMITLAMFTLNIFHPGYLLRQ